MLISPRLGSAGLFILLLSFLVPPAISNDIRMVSGARLSPDGDTIVFSWNKDIWTVPVAGGAAKALTRHAADDGTPAFSPDGTRLAFTSDRDGTRQLYVMPSDGQGAPERLTAHSEGYSVEDWHPDGEQILTRITRDHFWRGAQRFSLVRPGTPVLDRPLFDATGSYARLSPDGKQLLYTREGERWTRKGYTGSRACQIWLYNVKKRAHRKLIHRNEGACWPQWDSDGTGFYYAGQTNGVRNLRHHELASGKERQLTEFEDDSIRFPSISGDGGIALFRHLFDLYTLDLTQTNAHPSRVQIKLAGDNPALKSQRRNLDKATNLAFSKDGLEVAFIAGGDLWVMDTELREPVQITDTPGDEDEPLFAPDGSSIVFTRDLDGQRDLWCATRSDTNAFWWRNQDFELTQLTDDEDVEFNTAWSPDGEHISFLRTRGDFWIMKPDGTGAKRLFESWNRPSYDWSPDGQWLVYAVSDNDFNRDVWISPIDGHQPPINLSRHPDNDDNPRWSPDGKLIAFTGRRQEGQTDLYYVWLRSDDAEKDKRERSLDKALEKMKARAKKSPAKPEPPKKEEEKKEGEKQEKEEEKESEKKDDKVEEKKEGKKKKKLEIDVEDLAERVTRISISNSSESGLFWSHDSKKLAFTATVDGKRGTYTVEIAGEQKPKLLSTKTGGFARWIANGNLILWLSDGKPGTLDSKSVAKTFSFTARQELDLSARFQAAFDLSWRTMRDHFYDERLGNRDWNKVRVKYRDMASECPDGTCLETVINMMLGELNASHLGFRYRGPATAPAALKAPWSETTAHLGVRFAANHKGRGWRVRDVLPKSPAMKQGSRIHPGDLILEIDDTVVKPKTDPTAVLNGLLQRDIRLKVETPKTKNKAAEVREITLRPISFSDARRLLYEKWIDDNQKQVEKLGKGDLGYLHIAAMNSSSLIRFESELYSVGAGKNGLIIDVRDNGGGFTSDHLLTILTQPRHAITVPRGGGEGYPQDRKVYASWHKPVAVICNQNSFSNAEIFAHAMRTLKRGKVIGVPTAGGVISTGSRSVMDLGTLRMPFRGWYLLDGEDMERNGAKPHVLVWPQPGQLPSGRDPQLSRAVKVLKADVKRDLSRKKQPLKNASER